jgi:DNA-binding transcriptional ArsR family regulator
VTAVEEVLGALADPTRRDLLERLSVHGYATATTLAAELPISRQAVVQHLAVLDAVGLVHGQRFGRENRFVVRPERLTEAARWMNVLAARWDQRLAIIRQLAEAAEAGQATSATTGPAESSDPRQ